MLTHTLCFQRATPADEKPPIAAKGINIRFSMSIPLQNSYVDQNSLSMKRPGGGMQKHEAHLQRCPRPCTSIKCAGGMAKQFVKGTSGSMGVIYSTSVQVALTNCDSRVLDNTWVILLKFQESMKMLTSGRCIQTTSHCFPSSPRRRHSTKTTSERFLNVMFHLPLTQGTALCGE